ncbi:hypothetical protein EON63_20640 [archaeon]|nr:MAG: hypothetical protein EON63_20640 [archaeon]
MMRVEDGVSEIFTSPLQLRRDAPLTLHLFHGLSAILLDLLCTESEGAEQVIHIHLLDALAQGDANLELGVWVWVSECV